MESQGINTSKSTYALQERKLALSHDILMTVEKPARYIGGEVNAVMKDPSKVKVRFAMCFPDVYEIGMSHLGLQILYDMFNAMEDVWCERVFSPCVDLDEVMRRSHIPLFALESQDPVKDFDFLGVTIQYEMCYTNILQVLDLAQIPLNALERGENCPIVIGGGPCTYNPEPLADFFDMFYLGEGETRYRELMTLYEECREQQLGRVEFLRQAPWYLCAPVLSDRLPGGRYHRALFPCGGGHPFVCPKRDRERHETCVLSHEARSSVYQGDTRSGGAGDPERLHPGLPFLPGGTDLPSCQGEGAGDSKTVCRGTAEKHRA